MKKEIYISKIYGEGSQDRPDTSHFTCVALTFYVLCLI